MKRKVCVITGTRAEYGLLRLLIQGLSDDTAFELQLLATGSHLSADFGLTYREIEDDGFRIDEKVEILKGDNSAAGVARSVGHGVIGITDALERLKPDIVVLLGDRFELLAAASSAMLLGIPIAHIHGGEVTEGAFDDAIRHAVTKMASFHFVAAKEYRNRVIQLGEAPAHVFLVGGLGIDVIRQTKLMARPELEASLGISLGKKSLLVTFHPPTREAAGPESQMAELLAALEKRTDTQLIFTMPNADTGATKIAGLIDAFVTKHSNAISYASLGSRRYLSCMAAVDGVVGNSSSGLLEAPALKVGTVNIGDRQQGRLKAPSVIDCPAERGAISGAIDRLYAPDFRKMLAGDFENPYGTGGATARILDHLRELPLKDVLKKSFYDLPAGSFDGIVS